LAFLAAASTTLAASLDWEQTLAQVAELAVPRLADVCAISLVVDDRIAVVKVAHVDPDGPPPCAGCTRSTSRVSPTGPGSAPSSARGPRC
jgi:hypothetical protein